MKFENAYRPKPCKKPIFEQFFKRLVRSQFVFFRQPLLAVVIAEEKNSVNEQQNDYNAANLSTNFVTIYSALQEICVCTKYCKEVKQYSHQVLSSNHPSRNQVAVSVLNILEFPVGLLINVHHVAQSDADCYCGN